MARIGHNSGRNGTVYAITFDLDTQMLEQSYGGTSWRNAYTDIRNALDERGFEWRQGSVHFGNENVTAVDCVLVVQDMTHRFPWFSPSVRDIRMLRIEENNDLLPAVEQATRAGRPS